MQTLIVNNQDGSIQGVNANKVNEIPFFLCTNVQDVPNAAPNELDNTLTLNAFQAYPEIVAMTVSGEGPMKLFALAADRTGAARVKLALAEGDSRRALCNTSLHIDTIFGNGPQPYPLAEELYSDELRRLMVELTDISGATNVIRLVGHCARYLSEKTDPGLIICRERQEHKEFLSIPFWYTADKGQIQLLANQSVQVPVTINDDAHFSLSQLSAVSTGLFSIDIIDAAKGESILSAPQGNHYEIDSRLLFGDNHFPYCFSEPILVQIKQRLVLSITDLSGAANDVDITLHGRAIADRLWK